MDTDLPQLPPLLSEDQFRQTSKTWATALNRSEAIETIASSIGEYHEARQTYEQSQAAYLQQPSPETYAQLTAAFNAAAGHFISAQRQHQGLAQLVINWGPNDHKRGGTQGVQRLWGDLQQGSRQLDDGMRSLHGLSMSQGGAPLVPKVNHQVWVGGPPTQAVINNAAQWAQSGHQVNLWTDPNNMLAADMKTATGQLRGYGFAEDPALPERSERWDRATDEQRRNGLDAQLAKNNPHHAWEAQRRRQETKDLSIPDVRIRDVNAVFEPRRTHGPGELTNQDRANLQHSYQREMSLRGNLAAASDLVRPAILHDHPGIYTDYDVAPPIKGMPGLISTWNGVVAQRLNTLSGGRNEALSVSRPDFHMIDGQRKKLDPRGHHTPAPIPPNASNQRLSNESYKYLQHAVEEHLGNLRTGRSDSEHYRNLTKYAHQHDPDRRMMNAFDNWKSRTVSLTDAFENLPDLRVPADSFRALSTSGAFANSNAVLASSTRGAADLTQYTRQMVDNTNQIYDKRESSNPEHRAQYERYMNDSQSNSHNYKSSTMGATGPTAMTQFLNQAGKQPADPSVQLPPSYFANFTSDERNSTWVPGRPEQPRQRADRPRHDEAIDREEPPNRTPREGQGRTENKGKGIGRFFKK